MGLHTHLVTDGDNRHFTIDPITRQITNNTQKITLIKNDHNSERFTFELPKTIEGHNMNDCNVIQVHYINIDGKTRAKNEDIYEVKDKKVVSIDGQEKIEFSWLVSENATKYAGTLSFAIRFACTTKTDGVTNVDYAWNTAIYSGISIADGINNSTVLEAEYSDILQQWYEDLAEATRPLSYSDIITLDNEPQLNTPKSFNVIDFNITPKIGDMFFIFAKGLDGSIVSGRIWLLIFKVHELFTVDNVNKVTCLIYDAQEIPGSSALVLNLTLNVGEPPVVSDNVIDQREFTAFNRKPILGDTFIVPAIDNHGSSYILQCEITDINEEHRYADYVIREVMTVNALVFNETITFETTPRVNDILASEYKHFNRTPKVGEIFTYPATVNNAISYIIQAEVIDLTSNVDYKIKNVIRVTGSRIEKTELISSNESGNTYKQTFDDGSMVEFIAPKGEKGDPGSKIINTTLKSSDETGNTYVQTFNDGSIAEFVAPKGTPGSPYTTFEELGLRSDATREQIFNAMEVGKMAIIHVSDIRNGTADLYTSLGDLFAGNEGTLIVVKTSQYTALFEFTGKNAEDNTRVLVFRSYRRYPATASNVFTNWNSISVGKHEVRKAVGCVITRDKWTHKTQKYYDANENGDIHAKASTWYTTIDFSDMRQQFDTVPNRLYMLAAYYPGFTAGIGNATDQELVDYGGVPIEIRKIEMPNIDAYYTGYCTLIPEGGAAYGGGIDVIHIKITIFSYYLSIEMYHLPLSNSSLTGATNSAFETEFIYVRDNQLPILTILSAGTDI